MKDIRRSAATSIPEVLRLVPGVEVSRGVSSTWAIGISWLWQLVFQIGAGLD
jgi:outer membrane receptor for Fe3+-dicitrate